MNKLESMDIRKLVLTMAGPITISMLVQALYNIVDSIFIAKYSQDALLAVSLCYPVQTIMIAVSCGIGVGFNSVLARALGSKNFDKANKTVAQGILIALFNWILFAVLGILFSESFLRMFNSDPSVISMGNTYIRVCTIFSVGVFVQITYERIVQATGNAIYNMLIQGVGALINIILDPIFIFYFDLGVLGAAAATVIGQCCAMLLGVFIVQKYVTEVKLQLTNFRLNPHILREIYRIGIPAMLMQSVMSFMTVFMNMILVQFSDLAISVFNVYYKLQQFIFMAINGITNALVPIISYNIGANKKDRAFHAISFSLKISTAIMIIGLLLFQLFPYQLLTLFSADKAMFDLGVPALRIISYSFIFAGVNMVLCSSLQALNHAGTSLWITIFRQMLLLLPITYGLAMLFGLEVGWYSFLITEVLCMIGSVYSYLRIKKAISF